MPSVYTSTATGEPPCVQPTTAWPEILVGPIVRRVDARRTANGKDEPASVAVFLALSVAREVRLHVYDGVNVATATLVVSSPWVTALPVGDRLHLALPRAVSDALARGKVYGYDIETRAVGASTSRRLKDHKLLEGEYPLGYTSGNLPSFVLPELRAKLRFVHASCRKPHGGGPDSLTSLDLLLANSLTQLDRRPQQLFLTGDQIYADDVAIALLNTLSPLGEVLLGWREKLDLDKAIGATTQIEFNHAAVKPGSRSDFLFDQIHKPRTHYAQNHLLFFGDWCAMYVMAWSPALWKPSSGTPGLRYDMTDADKFGVVPQATTLSGLARSLAEVSTDQSAKEHFDQAFVEAAIGRTDTTTPVREYANGLPRIRRALANIATLMIFDDHEITDDWYLNGEIWLRLRGTKVGRRLMRNGLLAYMLFQDWGNRPAEYEKSGPYLDLLNKVKWQNTTDGVNSSNTTSCDALLDIAKPATATAPNALATLHANPRANWHYAIAWEDHVVCVLDTRTWRYFPASALAVSNATELVLADYLANLPQNLAAGTPISWLGAAASSKLHAQNTEGALKLNAWLIEPSAMATQVSAGTSLLRKSDGTNRLLFVVSPAPVFGFYIVEMLQRLMIVRDGAGGPTESGAEQRDNEPWIGSPEATGTLLYNLADQPTVILSGDVHYAYSTRVDWALGQGKQTFLQLCSSSSKNSEPLTEVLAMTDHLTDFAEGVGELEFRITLEGLAASAALSFTPDLLVQSKFLEDLEDKVHTVIGGKVGDVVQDVSKLPQSFADNIVAGYAKYSNDPLRVLTGDVLVELPTMSAKLREVFEDPVDGLNCKLVSLKDSDSENRFLAKRAAVDWYAPFRSSATSWFNGFSWIDRAFVDDWNYVSVGHSNIGLVYFETKEGKPNIVHELLWYTNLVPSGAQRFLGADSISTHPMLSTRHFTPWPP